MIVAVRRHIKEELHREIQRELTAQRAHADTMKLVATFVSGVAAAVVVGGLEVSQRNAVNAWSAGLLLGSVILAVSLMLFDRLVEPDVDAVLIEAAHREWNGAQISKRVRLSAYAAAIDNRKVLQTLQRLLYYQVSLAAGAGCLGAIAMLQ